jgi:nitrite reductase (NO-forming)
MELGTGIENVYPPLAKADYLMADKKRSIQQVLYGASGEMKVNGKLTMHR